MQCIILTLRFLVPQQIQNHNKAAHALHKCMEGVKGLTGYE